MILNAMNFLICLMVSWIKQSHCLLILTAIRTENLVIFLISMNYSLLIGIKIGIKMLTLRIVMKIKNYVHRVTNSVLFIAYSQ